MGTGGAKSKDKHIAKIAEVLNNSLRIANFEFPSDSKQELLRNTQQSGLYLFKFGNREFEIEIRPKSK